MTNEQKTSGRPSQVELSNGIKVQLPQEFSREQIDKVPKPPEDLNDTGLATWYRVWITVEELTRADYLTVHTLCKQMDELKGLERERNLTKAPPTIKANNGTVQRNPLFLMINDARENITRSLRELGLTPKARSQMNAMDSLNENDSLVQYVKEARKLDEEQAKKREEIKKRISKIGAE